MRLLKHKSNRKHTFIFLVNRIKHCLQKKKEYKFSFWMICKSETDV